MAGYDEDRSQPLVEHGPILSTRLCKSVGESHVSLHLGVHLGAQSSLRICSSYSILKVCREGYLLLPFNE